MTQVRKGLRRPGWHPQSQIPQGVGCPFLPAPELYRFLTEGCAHLLPAAYIAPTCDHSAPGQVHLHGRLGSPSWPARNPCDLRQPVHRSTGVETGCQGRPGIEAVTLVVKSSGAASGIDVLFQDGDIETGACQDGSSRQTTAACANDHYVYHPLSSFPRQF